MEGNGGWEIGAKREPKNFNLSTRDVRNISPTILHF